MSEPAAAILLLCFYEVVFPIFTKNYGINRRNPNPKPSIDAPVVTAAITWPISCMAVENAYIKIVASEIPGNSSVNGVFS